VTVPIITASTATVPGRRSSEVRRVSGGRTPTTPSRCSNGEMRANRLKYTENASARSIHGSTP